MDMAQSVTRRCQGWCSQLLRECQLPSAVWSMNQAVYSYIVIGIALAIHGSRELVLSFDDPLRLEADGLQQVGFCGIAICAICFLSVKLWTNARMQEVAALLTMVMAFASTTLLSACLRDDLLRNRSFATWRVFSLFPPLVLRWRLSASLVYALLNLAKDLAFNRFELARHPEVPPATVSSILFLQVAMCMCYAGFAAETRRYYFAEIQLAEEKESMRSLLHMQCEAVVSLDTHRRITCPGLEAILGDSLAGKPLTDFLADGEEPRLSNALDTVKSTKKATPFHTTFLVNGNEMLVELFLVHCSGKDSFLVGVRISQECLPPNADIQVSASRALQHFKSPTASVTMQDMESEARERGTEYVFEVTALRSISDIVELGNREHWLIQKEALDFQRSKLIGEGGFGKVMTAEFRGASVAVKMPHLDLETDNRKRQVLLELRMLRHLHHPNIVEFFGATVDVADAHLAIGLVFELVGEGATCSDLVNMLDYTTGLDEGHQALLLHILDDTGIALSYMHGLEPPVVHQDVKGRNILCSLAPGARVQAKLCDFGLSHHTGREKFGGTANMMAPEVFMEQPVTPAADVFAFGRLLFLILTGISPLRGMKRERIMQLTMEGSLPSLDWETVSNSSWSEAVISACQELSEACTSFQVEKRPNIDCVTQQISGLRSLHLAGQQPKGETDSRVPDALQEVQVVPL
eukprot:TRINITY_DN16490_c0_g2_i2.p1 TRINITY_DN16490_c0_g2~~TRINITY_DN16490_c0_g2_i2.p1  ORF type:complete len:694 (-),score=83.72 TRINITY_DN16490_c0_g2_i2:82-2163(-)